MADNGVYKCKATYPSYGTTEESVTINVRAVKAAVSATYKLEGTATATLTCTFYGDALGATVWTKGDVATSLATITDDYTVTAGTYANQMREDKLIIKVVAFADAGTYKCEASYTSDSAKKSATQTLTTLGK